jgi:serine/threonine protein kinase
MKERVGDYALKELLGKGGMAEVFRAVGLKGANEGRSVALKMLKPELAKDPMFVDSFVGEADVSRQLRHPNIVGVLETGIDGDNYFIVMDLIDGVDLSKIIAAATAQKVKLSVDVCCFIAHVTALALDYAHRLRSKKGEPLGLVHCDVTPSNIFIAKTGTVRLGDFGVAHSKLIHSQLAEQGIAGKAPYLAPEQINFEAVSPATDVFALGAILFEILSGRRAFQGKGVGEIMKKVVAGGVPIVSTVRNGVSAKIDGIVNRALTAQRPVKNAQKGLWSSLTPARLERYATAAHMAIDLESAYDTSVGTETALAALVRGLFP